MDLSFHVNLACGKLTEVEYKTTTHEGAIAKYSANVEKQNMLEEGTLKDAITTAVPFKPCMYYRECMAIFSHAVCGTSSCWCVIADSRSYTYAPAQVDMLLDDSFGKEGGAYVVDVKPEFLKYFLAGSEY